MLLRKFSVPQSKRNLQHTTCAVLIYKNGQPWHDGVVEGTAHLNEVDTTL